MSDLSNFLLTTGRTLSQMALYSPEHPTVKSAIDEAHALLDSLLHVNEELSLSLSDGKLLVNGKEPERISNASLRPFVQLLTIFNLHSLTFLPGIAKQELIPFFRLAYSSDLKKQKLDMGEFFKRENALHITVNQAKYTKIAENEKIGQGQETVESKQAELIKSLEQLPLDQFIKTLIENTIDDPGDQSRLFEYVSNLIRKEIEQVVMRETRRLRGEKLQATNERDRTESVVENMADGVVVVDETGNVLMMNDTAEHMYGVKLGECLGKPLWQGVKEEQMVALAKELALPKDKPLTKEVELRAEQDTRKTLRNSMAAVQDPNGRIVGMVSVLSDVTKQKDLNRIQNEFMANVTHDLRAPIHALKLAVVGILEGVAGPVTAEQNRMLSLASRNVDRLSRLINDLLDFSQIESGKLKIHPQVLELGPFLKESTSSYDAWSKSRHITLELDVDPNLNSVYADSDRFLQIMSNLISNAIKFSPDGGRVSVRAKNGQEGTKKVVRLEVEDEGKGISQADQKKIFQRFMQLHDQPKLDVKGTGLGLSICQALVQQHKGKMGIDSPVPGKKNGSIFWFALPSVERSAGPPTLVKPIVEGHSRTQLKKGFWRRLLSRLKFSFLIFLFLPSIILARPHWGRVRRVLEGDLVLLEDGSKVRYLGIDAPNKGSRYFSESKSANRSWVENKEVRFRYGLQERTADGVWQAYVFIDGVFVNKQMVAEGYALVARMANEGRYLGELIKAERQAHKKKRGIWADTVIDPYPVRSRRRDENPWASQEEQKKGFKIDVSPDAEETDK